MKREVKVRLTWRGIRPARLGYPRGKEFAMPARFEHQGDDWTKNAWSVVVLASTPVAPDSTQDVRVRFLMDNAPHEWLLSGRRFELHEGPLVVAEGTIE